MRELTQCGVQQDFSSFDGILHIGELCFKMYAVFPIFSLMKIIHFLYLFTSTTGNGEK